MRLGLSMRTLDRHGETHEAVGRAWFALLEGEGHEVVLLPGGLSRPVAYAGRLGIEGLVLTGGNDPAAVEGALDPDAPRDATEAALLAWALESGRPVLGVCRGLQMLNLHLGGRVARDAAGDAHVAKPHEVALVDDWGGRLKGQRERQLTNSFHRNGIWRADLAPRLRPLAVSADGLVEAAFLADAPVVAVMWHPERPGACRALDAAIRGALFGKEGSA